MKRVRASYLMILLLFAVVADIITTEIGIENGAYELNPVARWLLENMGYSGLWLMKMIIMSAAAALYAKTKRPHVILAWSLIHYAVVCWNIIQLLILFSR